MEPEKPKDLLDWLGVSDAPNWRVARPLGSFIAVALTLLFILALIAAFAVIFHTIGTATSGTKEGINLGAGALVAAMLGAPFVIWGTFLKYQTVRYQKEGHITDRINKAVEQLGAEKTVKYHYKGKSGNLRFRPKLNPETGKEEEDFNNPVFVEETVPNIEVRIGAILSLERIAQDSTSYDNGRDHVRVMEILCAYVRENSNATAPQDFPEPEWEPLSDDASAEEREKHKAERRERFGHYIFGKGKAWKWAQALPNPRPDISQAIRVLAQRTAAQRQAEAAWPDPPDRHTVWPFDMPCPTVPEPDGDQARTCEEIKTFRSDLSKWRESLLNYSGYRLDLRDANLQRADMSGGNFSGARLDRARMEGAFLASARMEGAELRDARMEGIFLYKAQIGGAALARAWLEGADLFEAQMQGADLKDARIEGANFWKARLDEIILRRARMYGTFFDEARMRGADLIDARMNENTFLPTADVSSAAAKAVCLKKVAITADQIKSMFGDTSVKLPEGIAKPEHWPDWELPWFGEHNFNKEWRKWQADPESYTPPSKPED